MGRSFQSTLLILLLLLTTSLFAELQQEEGELVLPADTVVQDTSSSDSTKPEPVRLYDLSLKSSYYFNRLATELTWQTLKKSSASYHHQGVTYLLDYDVETERRLQQLTLHGEVSKKLRNSWLGLEWLPAFFANEDLSLLSGYGVGSLSIGPVYTDTLISIPLRLSGGYALDVWNQELQKNWFESKLDETESDNGIYFTVKAGSKKTPLLGKGPFFGWGGIHGRYMSSSENSRVTTGDVSLYYADSGRLGADSIYIYTTDTLVHGRAGTVVGYSGDLSSDPVRVDNKADVTVELERLGEAALQPDFSVSFRQHQYYYPNAPVERNALKERWFVPALSIEKLLMEKKDTLFYWDGGLEIGYGEELNAYNVELDTLPDSLIGKYHTSHLSDKDIFQPYLWQKFTYVPREWLTLSYGFEVEREEKLYPYTYENEYGTVKHSVWSRDMQHLSHDLLLSFLKKERFAPFLKSIYRRNLLYYLHGSQSSSSYKEEQLTLESGCEITWNSTSNAKVYVGGYAEPRRYLFKEDLFNRELYGVLSGVQGLSELWSLGYELRVLHFDRGDLYSGNLYGITEKRDEVQGSLTGAYRFIPKSFLSKIALQGIVSFGLDGRYQEKQIWDYIGKKFVDYTIDAKFNRASLDYTQISPSFSIKLLLKKEIFVDLKIRRYIEDGISSLEDYWDLALTVEMDRF